jgi:orotidine 5'-phosphate decarboxylase subfamily 1
MHSQTLFLSQANTAQPDDTELLEQQHPDSFTNRAKLSKNPQAAEMFLKMVKKQSMTVPALDVKTEAELLRLAALLGPHVPAIKVHLDIIRDFRSKTLFPTDATADKLRKLADELNFLIIVDRKLADIGNTAEAQLNEGVFDISSFADLATVHAISGPGMLATLQATDASQKMGFLMVAEMSSKGTLAKGEYTKQVLDMCEGHSAIAGLISQTAGLKDRGTLHATPGVDLGKKNDNSDQQFNTPEVLIAGGSDILIVGRNIYTSAEPVKVTQIFNKAGLEAYYSRLRNTPVLQQQQQQSLTASV